MVAGEDRIAVAAHAFVLIPTGEMVAGEDM